MPKRTPIELRMRVIEAIGRPTAFGELPTYREIARRYGLSPQTVMRIFRPAFVRAVEILSKEDRLEELLEGDSTP